MDAWEANTARGVRKLKQRFTDREEMFRVLSRELANTHGKVTIMGGHHMVAYRPGVGLCAVLQGDADDQRTTYELKRAEEWADFPEVTFEFAARLVRELPGRDSRIALLVDDERMKMSPVNPGLPDGPARAALRRNYFFANAARIPPLFQQILERHDLTLDIFERDDVPHASDNTLPAGSLRFSESVLKARFNHQVDKLGELPLYFKWCPNPITGHREFKFVPPEGNSILLLDNDGPCQCSPTMLEFLMTLSRLGARTLVLFVPEWCREQADGAIGAALVGLLPPTNVFAVWSDWPSNGAMSFTQATFYHAAPSTA